METLRERSYSLLSSECSMIAKQLNEERNTLGTALVSLGDVYSCWCGLLTFRDNGQIKVFEDAKGNLIGILIYDVGSQWWSKDLIVTELFVYCINKTYKGFGRVALDALDTIAKEYDAKAIIAGSYFMKSNKIITNMYRKKGYREESPCYIKMRDGETDD